MNPCTEPQPSEDIVGDGRWMSMHNRYVSEAITAEPDVLFIGDSIIQQLQYSDLWNEKINALHCLNFGIGGDRVENVLWRLLNGELDANLQSKVKCIVLFVGTNNHDCTPDQIFEGIIECIKVIRDKMGCCHIVLPTLLPRGQKPNKLRIRNDEVNKLMINYFKTDPKPDNTFINVHIVEIDKNIVQSDGTISHHLLHDYLHLSNGGYMKIFGPVYEILCDLLKK